MPSLRYRIVVDEDTVLNGAMPCPNCGEMLEFEVEEEDDEADEAGDSEDGE